MYVDRDRRGERGRNIGRDRRGKKRRAGGEEGEDRFHCDAATMHGDLGLHRTYIRDGIPLRIGWLAIAPVQVPVMSRVHARIPRGSNRYGTRTDLHTPQLCDNCTGTKRGGERW